MIKPIKWHRILGTVLRDMFTGRPLKVELETDLSIRKQMLDIVIIKKGKGELSDKLPDGFGDLVEHNLITYKSMHEPLDCWALFELIGHFINYRKQQVEEGETLPPMNVFNLYAISTRFPQKLKSEVELIPESQGLYRVTLGVKDIKVIVLNRIPKKEHNALWHLFSANKEQIAYGAEHYEKSSEMTSTVLNQLFAKYQLEGIDMPYTMENFKHDVALEHLSSLTLDERLQNLPNEEVAQRLSLDERLQGLPVDEVVKSLPPEKVAQSLSPEVRLKGISAEEIEFYLEQIKANKSNPDEK